MKTIILLLIFSSTYINAQTYSDFVSSNMMNLHTEIFNEISVVDEQTAPKEVKELRKKIGLFKIYLDLGIFLYPKKNNINWKELRSEIDTGYFVYGNFKDLYDVSDHLGNETDIENVKKLRKDMLKWNELALNEAKDWKRYLSNPLEKGALKIKNKNLPKFLWAQVDYRPKAQEKAEEVLYKLTNKIFDKSAKGLNKFVKIKSLLKEKDEIYFHDFRKLVRTSLKLVTALPELQNMTNDLSRETLLNMISQIGDINDILVAFHKSNKEELKKQIDYKWRELKKWIKANDIKSHLKNIL